MKRVASIFLLTYILSLEFYGTKLLVILFESFVVFVRFFMIFIESLMILTKSKSFVILTESHMIFVESFVTFDMYPTLTQLSRFIDFDFFR